MPLLTSSFGILLDSNGTERLYITTLRCQKQEL